MADKSVGELIAAQSVTPTDLFVLEQNGTAKKLTGQTLENWLVSFAEGHGGIQLIVKHSTSGLKDTYRITLADTTTFDFIVTNGRSISSVDQTDVSGLTRTYTIAFNDGTSKTFNVTDGRSIADIGKTGTNVLTDTYTISYNDGTSSTFTVKNGRGIKSFEKVSTVELVDTYRITYNDDTFDEFTVTNGAKGDKGDNTYLWIKYASQEPTETGHSFGDLPDNWIGIYYGPMAEAPEDWSQYSWFEIKGANGDTGEPAVLVSESVTYRVGEVGNVIPSGSWTENIPAVPQGKYLWTKTAIQFNSGEPITSYSVARFGMDGSGSVSSVANVSPDENGNVPLTASDVVALPLTGGEMQGPVNMAGNVLSGLNAPVAEDEAATKGSSESYTDRQILDRVIYSGGKNLLKIDSVSRTTNGITFTVNADGSVTINGTATADADMYIGGTYGEVNAFAPAGNYTLTGTHKANVEFFAGFGNGHVGRTNEGDTSFTAPNGIAWVVLRVYGGNTVSNYTVYPMIRLASETDATYEPYYKGLADLTTRGMKLLWANASPDSAFGEQQVVLPEEGFSHFAIECNLNWGYYQTFIFTKGKSGLLSGYFGQHNIHFSRMVGIYSQDGICTFLFLPGYSDATQNNDVCIPVKIYGLKGVIA